VSQHVHQDSISKIPVVPVESCPKLGDVPSSGDCISPDYYRVHIEWPALGLIDLTPGSGDLAVSRLWWDAVLRVKLKLSIFGQCTSHSESPCPLTLSL